MHVYLVVYIVFFFFFSSRRRHTRSLCDWSSDVCSSDLAPILLDGYWEFQLALVATWVLAGVGLVRAMGRSGPPVRRWSRSEERRVGKECRSRWWPYR